MSHRKTLRFGESLSVGGTIRIVLADDVHRTHTLRQEYRQVNTATSTNHRRPLAFLYAGLMVLASLASTGCQMDIAGQTLPSPYYLSDDVQYYAPGPEFKLAREAAALKEQNAAIASQQQQR